MSSPTGNVGIYGELATGGWGSIGVTASTQATGTLTLSSNAVAGETVTIGPRRYTWATSANTQTPNVVKVGADASTSIDNLIAAINGTAASQGSLYSFNTVPSAQVSAAQGAGDTMVVTALAPGSDGNSVATTETMSGGAWGAVTLTGGTPGAITTSSPAPPGGNPVVGITEKDTFPANPVTTATTTVTAGALWITVIPLTGFIGSINGMTWLDAATADASGGLFSRTAMPGNVLDTYTITRSAGKYSVLQGRPT